MLELMPAKIVPTLDASPGHKPFNLKDQLSLGIISGYVPTTFVPSTTFADDWFSPIALETVAAVTCPQCWAYSSALGKSLPMVITPVPLSDPAQGWITYPCHQQECGSCYELATCNECTHCDSCGCECEPDCDNCECKPDYCECYHCGHCGNPVNSDDYCGDCDRCESCCACSHCSGGCSNKSFFGCCGECANCGCNCDHEEEDSSSCDCSECKPSRRASATTAPPWVTRGDPMPSETTFHVYKDLADQSRVMGIDPVQAMADFYLCDYVAAVLTLGYPSYASHLFGPLLRDARTLQESIVQRCDELFRVYTFAAIGGEIRHHSSVRPTFPRDRNGAGGAWDYWHAMGECGDKLRLAQDCADLFSDHSWGGSIGGENWAVIARTLVARLNGTLDARTFVDRVFSLQHNNGSLLNKAEWPCLNGKSRGVEYCQSIGEAHAAEGKPINFRRLLACASDEARALVIELVRSHSSKLAPIDRANLEETAEWSTQCAIWWGECSDEPYTHKPYTVPSETANAGCSKTAVALVWCETCNANHVESVAK